MRTSLEIVLVFSIFALLSSCAGLGQNEADESRFEPFPLVQTGHTVIEPPKAVHAFYKKYINADGILIVGSENVTDAALLAARSTILRLTSKCPDVHKAIVANNARISIMGFSETASDLPEFGPGSDGEWGLGQMPGDPTSLVSEKGISYEGNTEYIANFLLHEFVHVVHNLGMPATDPEIVDEIYAAYLDAVEEGRFMKPPNAPPEDANALDEYRDDEYFTHSVNAYYDLNESLPGPWVDIEIGDWGQRSGTREELMANDSVIYGIIEQFFPDSLED